MAPEGWELSSEDEQEWLSTSLIQTGTALTTSSFPRLSTCPLSLCLPAAGGLHLVLSVAYGRTRDLMLTFDSDEEEEQGHGLLMCLVVGGFQGLNHRAAQPHALGKTSAHTCWCALTSLMGVVQ